MFHCFRLSMFSSHSQPCSWQGRASGRELCTHCPQGPLLVWLLQPSCRSWERAAFATVFLFNQSVGPNFPVPESGLISMEGSRLFSWISMMLSLWRFLYCSGWFFTPLPALHNPAGALARPTADPCWLLGGMLCKPYQPGCSATKLCLIGLSWPSASYLFKPLPQCLLISHELVMFCVSGVPSQEQGCPGFSEGNAPKTACPSPWSLP